MADKIPLDAAPERATKDASANRQVRTFLREAFAVLSAILIAFALDAAWETRREKQETHEALAAVLDEFRVVRDQLIHAINTNRNAVANKDRFVVLNPAGIDDIDESEAYSLVASLRGNWTLDPSRGALDAMIASGRLDQVEDQQLKSLLAGWPSVYQDLGETTIPRWRDDVTRRKAEVGLEATQRRVRTSLDAGRPSGARDLLRRAKADQLLNDLAAAYAGELEAYLSKLELALQRAEETIRHLEAAVR